MPKATGWICPKCGRVYSPDVKECWRCNPKSGTQVSSLAVYHRRLRPFQTVFNK
jgi:uncharacterized OB-fold protein